MLAWIYQLTMPLVGNLPWKWHIFAAWRGSAAALWLLLRKVWPQRRELAVWAPAVAVYPGLTKLYPIAYAHYFLTESFFFVSLLLTVLACGPPAGRQTPLHAADRLAWPPRGQPDDEPSISSVDLVRPLLIWVVLAQDETQGKRKWRRALLLGLP